MSFQYIIPDLLANWPWKRVLNPKLVEVNDDANAWVKSLGLFDQAQLQKFNACDFSTLIFTLYRFLVYLLTDISQIFWRL